MSYAALRSKMTGSDELRGLCLLVVEDDYIVATDLCLTLRARGAAILGPVANSRQAQELLHQHQPDWALLDINLNGAFAFQLAAQIRAAGVQVVFVTGYDTAFLPPGFHDVPCLQKPLDLNALVQLIGRAPVSDKG
jgi:CheY-like chemotaxis protein